MEELASIGSWVGWEDGVGSTKDKEGKGEEEGQKERREGMKEEGKRTSLHM